MKLVYYTHAEGNFQAPSEMCIYLKILHMLIRGIRIFERASNEAKIGRCNLSDTRVDGVRYSIRVFLRY